jgi:hypothetical protein
MSRGRWFDAVWLLAFGLLSSAWCVSAARELGATYDEPTYLELGLTFWRTGSHRQLMRLGTMPLPMDVQTLPLAIAERLRGEPWHLDADFQRLLPWMRHGNLVFWWLLLFSALRLGRDLGGPWGGRLAVTFIALEPNFLAHAALATTDIAITAAVVGLAVAFQRGRDQGWLWRVGLPGAWMGLALLSKASALVFGPVVLFAVEVTRLRADGISLRAFGRDAISIGLIGFGIALVGCGSDFAAEESFVRWAGSRPSESARSFWLAIAEHLCIFGNAGEALVMQVKHNLRGHGQFLLGSWGVKPFWYYFPLVFAIKLTVPMLLAALIVGRRWRDAATNPAIVAAAMLLAFSLTCRVQIGIRLQLAFVAFLAVGLASLLPLGMAGAARSMQRLAVAGLVLGAGWMTAGSLLTWPDGLRFVNELWGGPGAGPRLVSDSNYDWGQGLPELDRWHERSGRVPLDVWYFGRDPMLKRLPVRDLPLHCVTLNRPGDMASYCWGRYLAVGASVRYGRRLSPAHDNALQFLEGRAPVARTSTFLIYDLTDVPAPQQFAGGSP